MHGVKAQGRMYNHLTCGFIDKDIILSFNAYFINLCIIYYLLQKVEK